MSKPLRKILLTLSICFAWALTSVTPIWKYLSHPKAAAAITLGLIVIVTGMRLLTRLNRSPRQINSAWFLLLFLTLTAAFAVLYPASLKHTLNRGSDREDALRIELHAIQHHQYPYDARTFLGNPPTPLPGAMLLAAPFYAIGHIAWQNILWLALFFLFAIHFFRYRATALFFLALFLLFAPGNLNDLTSGGDYLTNFFYVAIAIALFTQALSHSLYISTPAAVFLGITLSSRIPYAFILIPLLSLTLQRTTRTRTAILFLTTLAAASAITLPVFAPHPIPHLLQQLNQNAIKLRYIPTSLHPQWTLPLIAAVTACIAFRRKMSLPRLFLNFSISSFLMLAPFVFTFAFASQKLWYAFFYLSGPALSFALWALSAVEDTQESHYAHQSLPTLFPSAES